MESTSFTSLVRTHRATGTLRRGYFCMARNFAMALAVLAGLSSCSDEPPAIKKVVATRIEQYDTKHGETSHQLGLAISLSESSNPKTLDKILLSSAVRDQVWRVDVKNCEQINVGGAVWLLNSRIAGESGSSFPAGTYTMVLVDQAGRQSRVQQNLPEASRLPGGDGGARFVSASRAASKIIINPVVPDGWNVEIALADASGHEVTRYEMGNHREADLSQFPQFLARDKGIVVYCFSPGRDTVYVSGPW